MDKEPSYETFQFIEGNTNQDMNQLLVLQEDGTLLSVNRDIQYITQVQDDKTPMEDTQTCAVFDVSAQQFFVNVDNTPDLIVQEQFETPDADRNIYSNSFLIETETDTRNSIEQVEMKALSTERDIKLESQTEKEANANGKPVNNFTEITLTDAQYHLFEQKGWILLEFGGRVFVLDTLGLHDITHDDKLIEKLKIELEHNPQEGEQTETSGIVIESDVKVNLENDVKNEDFEGQLQLQSIEPKPVEKEEITIEDFDEEACQQSTDETSMQEHPNLDTQPDYDSNDTERKCDSIKIKTKYTFHNIPEKIFLGRTAKGMKLYAKIKNKKHKDQPIKPQVIRPKTSNYLEARNDLQFVSILQDYLRDSPPDVQASYVIAADTVVRQLIQMPNILNTSAGNYVVVTKTIAVTSEDGIEKRRRPTTVTGEIVYGRFIHIPFLLQNLINPSNTETPKQNKSSQDFVELIHIDVTETKMPHKPSTPSINVCNRKIYLDVLRDAKKRHPNPVYACGACAAIFKYQSELNEHMENSDHCLGTADQDDALTIDTDQLQEQSDSYYMLDTGKNKWYSCMQCEAKFLKLSNCKKHVKSHMRPEQDGNKNSEIKEYKCKMCPSKYFHASSLTKHIVKRHIQGQTNK